MSSLHASAAAPVAVGLLSAQQQSGGAAPVATAASAKAAAPAAVSLPAAQGTHHHSWLHAPPRYTALSVLFFALFFLQPHAWRVALWARFRHALPADERLFIVAAGVLTHTLVFVGANLIMTAIYWAGLPFFEQFKIQPRAWPWQRGAAERAAYFALVRKSVALIAFNQLLLAPALTYFSYDSQKERGMTAAIDAVPPWYVSMAQITVAMLVEDTLFYWAHRLLHHPLIYGYVHKVHHQYKDSIGVASEYAHPLEFLFSNVIPFSAGPMLTGMHTLTLLQWTVLRVGETIDGHCGYEFPWSPYRLLPCSGSSTAHDYHHSHNVGNFASFFVWWDRWMGTDQAFRRWEARQQQLARIADKQAALLPVPQGTSPTNAPAVAPDGNGPAEGVTKRARGVKNPAK